MEDPSAAGADFQDSAQDVASFGNEADVQPTSEDGFGGDSFSNDSFAATISMILRVSLTLTYRIALQALRVLLLALFQASLAIPSLAILWWVATVPH